MPTEAETAAAYALLDGVLKDPKVRAKQLALLKEHKPDFVVPEIDAAAPINARIDGLQADNEKLRKELAERDASASMQSKFDKLQRDQGLTDEGVEKVKKLMVERSIPDPVDAAVIFASQQPKPDPAEPVGYSPTHFLDDTDKDLEPWFANEDRQAEIETANVLREIRAGRLN